MSSSIPFLRVTIDSLHMANANSGLTQFKELHIMRVGKTWGWSAWRYCIELVTFLKNVLRPHRTLIKASDLASQIAVSNSPYDRSISSFRVSQLQGLGSPFSVTLPPSLSVPRDPWLQLPLLCVIPPFWHREGVPRVAPDHNPPQPVLTWVMPKTTYRPGSPTREDFWEQQKTVWSIQVPWESNQSVCSVSSS